MAAITGPDSPLDAAVFSTAARRMLRPRTARTRHSGEVVTRAGVIGTINQCPNEQPPPSAGFPAIDTIMGEDVRRLAGITPIPEEIAAAMAELEGMTVDRSDPRYVDLIDRFRTVVADVTGVRPHDTYHLDRYQGSPLSWPVLVAVLRRWLPLDFDGRLVDLVGLLPEPRPSDCRAPDLGDVAGITTEALDPGSVQAPARRRVRGRIRGIDIDDLRPPEYPAGVDYATWILLRDREPEWLLPGVGKLEKDSVVAMQTNPMFIDAFLIGLNTQLMDEMRWRNIPIDRSTTPLLTFWRHVDYQTGLRVADIREGGSWPADSPLGAPSHQVPQPGDDDQDNDLVLVFRTDLFRRYPKTLVYLVKTPAAPQPPGSIDAKLAQTPVLTYPQAATSEQARAAREFIGPNFTGTVAKDIVFFSFDIRPTDLKDYWLVLDEPPAELRFRAPTAVAADAGDTSAAFAAATVDTPTRVAFNGRDLLAHGLL